MLLYTLGTSDKTNVPHATRKFLEEEGLPRSTSFLGPEMPPLVLSFDRLTRPLRQLLPSDTNMPEQHLAPDLAQLTVLGDLRYPNMTAWICVHPLTGHILLVDLERDHCIALLNNSIEALSSTLVSFLSSYNTSTAAMQDWDSSHRVLQEKLNTLDPLALAEPRCEWNLILQSVRNKEITSIEMIED